MASQLVKRADAARNVDRILEAAMHVFALDPSAGMAEVAAHAGVGRATLYRHFPCRDDLLEAIKARAREDVIAAVDGCPVDEGPALDCIARIVAAVIEQGDRYRFVAGRRMSEHDRRPAGDRLAAVLRAAVERGQRRGEITRSVPAEWAVASIRSAILTAMEALGDGRATQTEAERYATRLALHGLAPARRRK